MDSAEYDELAQFLRKGCQAICVDTTRVKHLLTTLASTRERDVGILQTKVDSLTERHADPKEIEEFVSRTKEMRARCEKLCNFVAIQDNERFKAALGRWVSYRDHQKLNGTNDVVPLFETFLCTRGIRKLADDIFNEPSAPESADPRKRLLRKAIQRLPAREKDVIMWWLLDLNHKDIADTMEVTETYSRVLRHRAIQRLKK